MNESGLAWYASEGNESDVVLSTRARLARNLANFPFPAKFKDDDATRVQTLVFDSFAHCSTPEKYQAASAKDFDELGSIILNERGVFDGKSISKNGAGIIIRNDGRLSCAVNDCDHIRIASFVAGLDIDSAYKLVQNVDEELQKSLQFAASFDLGFLTSSFYDCGSGLKISCRLHLPSLSFSKKLGTMFNSLDKNGITVRDVFGVGSYDSSSLGFFYQLSTKNAGTGSEIDQMANIFSAVKHILQQERNEREAILRNHQTEVIDIIYKLYAKAKFSTLIGLREGIEIISALKWGKNLGYFSGISDSDLCALLYRIQEGHLKFVQKDGNFSFPADIIDDPKLKTKNLRAFIIQESIEGVKVN